MKLTAYSAKTRALLAKPPAPGENRHHWLFKVQASLINQGFDALEVERRVCGLCKEWGWTDRLAEIPQNTAAIVSGDKSVKPSVDPSLVWPEINHEARRQRFSHPPIFTFESTGLKPADVFPHLYHETDWICVGRDAKRFATVTAAEAVTKAEQFSFIVPNPMRSKTGKTRAGTDSFRSADNACTEAGRKYAVIEFDTNDSPDEQIGALSSLHSTRTPLFMAVWSGNKSIHAWYDLQSLTKQQKRVFYIFARYLGADNALWGTSWFVRMPGGVRETGETQDILYFEPEHVNKR